MLLVGPLRRVRDVRGYARLQALRLRPARRARARACWRRTARSGVTTLIFANAFERPGSLPELATFFGNVERLGGGRLRIVLVNGWTSAADRDEERTILEDVATGAADLGWAGARAVGAVFGIRSIDPLLAPLLFPDEEAVRQFLAAASLAPLLAPLRDVGIAGLALLPGGVRRPFGISGPLVGLDDWQGKVIRTHASLSGFASIRALGAHPVLRSARELGGRPPRKVDGMDLHPRAVAARRYPGWLTRNVPLWPRLLLLAANQQRLDRLTRADRAVLEEAARQATADPGAALPSPTQVGLPRSVQLVEATEHDLARLRRQLQPVHDELRATSQGDRTLVSIERFLAA